MARLCIRVRPNPNTTDPSLDVLRTQEGDVVCIASDDHVFSRGERACGQYRFIDVPDATESELEHLVKSIVDARGQIVQRRELGLLMSALEDGTWKGRTSATKAQVDLITVTKI